MESGDLLKTTIDKIEKNRKKNIDRLLNKKKFSQYFTPVEIAKFMAELFDFKKDKK